MSAVCLKRLSECGRGRAICGGLRTGGRSERWDGADAVGAGAVAAEEALGEAGVGADKAADELDVEGADAAVAAGDVGKGAGVLGDQPVAVFFDAVGKAAALLDDRAGFADAFAEREAFEAVDVGLCDPSGDATEDGLQALRAGELSHLREDDGGELIVLFGEEGIAVIGEAVDERGPADAAALLVGDDEAVAFEDGEMLAHAGRREAEDVAEIAYRGAAFASKVVEDALAGALHSRVTAIGS